MVKRNLLLAVILMCALILMMSCSDDRIAEESAKADSDILTSETEPGILTIPLSKGSETFTGYEPEILRLDIENQGQIVQMDFLGISLDVVLENTNNYKNKEYSKVELVVSDMDENMDITEMAKADAGVFLAWSESGIPETPFCVFPKDAGTANLLTGSVTDIIITK